MKLQFKHQKFQADAAKAICDVFAGQPYRSSSFGIDPGYGQLRLTDNEDFLGYGNTRISNELNDVMILTENSMDTIADAPPGFKARE